MPQYKGIPSVVAVAIFDLEDNVASKFPIMCLDLNKCAFLVWSTARARALQQLTQLEWQPYRESRVLNAIYRVLFWKEGPGTVEIHQDRMRVAQLTQRFFDPMFDSFLDRAFTHGPAGLAAYANNLVSTRQHALESVQQLFAEASSINAEIAGETKQAIKILASYRLSSALVLAGTGCTLALAGGSAVVVAQIGLVKLGADVAGEIIKPHDHIGENVKGVAVQLIKFGTEKGADKLSEHVERAGEHALKQYGPKLESAQRRIERYSAELGRRIKGHKRARATGRLERAMADREVATSSIKSASRLKTLGKFASSKAFPLIFAAWDVYDAVKEYDEDTASGD
jgi:hypothetical protein